MNPLEYFEAVDRWETHPLVVEGRAETVWSSDGLSVRLEPTAAGLTWFLDAFGPGLDRWAVADHQWNDVMPMVRVASDGHFVPDDSSTPSLGWEDRKMYDVFGRIWILRRPDAELDLVLEEFVLDYERVFNQRFGLAGDNEYTTGVSAASTLAYRPRSEEEVYSGHEWHSWTLQNYSGTKDWEWDGESRARRPNTNGSGWDFWDKHAVMITADARNINTSAAGSGVLLNTSFVLTSAHIVAGFPVAGSLTPKPSPWEVCLFGSTGIVSGELDFCRSMLTYEVHPQWGPQPEYRHDMAVVRLASPFSSALVVGVPLPGAEIGDNQLWANTYRSAGYPEMRAEFAPVSPPIRNLNPAWIPTGPLLFRWGGRAYTQSGGLPVAVWQKAIYYKMDAMPGQSGSPVFAFNANNLLPFLSSINSGHRDVSPKAHGGPKMTFHKSWILGSMAVQQ